MTHIYEVIEVYRERGNIEPGNWLFDEVGLGMDDGYNEFDVECFDSDNHGLYKVYRVKRVGVIPDMTPSELVDTLKTLGKEKGRLFLKSHGVNVPDD